MIRFIVDAQLPPALARMLSASGYEAIHVQDVGLKEAKDTPIWEHALQEDWIVITKDEDFAHRLSQKPIQAPVVIWLRIGNASKQALLNWFQPLLKEIVIMVERGDRLIEVR